jgi:acyl-coenzyme A synthetase/AMP-(fatty) acid ligase
MVRRTGSVWDGDFLDDVRGALVARGQLAEELFGADRRPVLVQVFGRQVRSRLAKYKIPAYVDLVGRLPKTGSGKVQKSGLRKLPLSSGLSPR